MSTYPKSNDRVTSYGINIKDEKPGNRAIIHTLVVAPNAPYANVRVETSRDLQLKGVDCWLTTFEGKCLSAEFKNTFRNTGNHAFEDYHQCVYSPREWKGWFHTIESDLLFMFAAGPGLLHQIDYRKMREDFPYLRDMYKHAKPSYNRPGINGREDYKSYNVCIPFKDLRRFKYIIAEYPIVYPSEQSRKQVAEIVHKANAHMETRLDKL